TGRTWRATLPFERMTPPCTERITIPTPEGATGADAAADSRFRLGSKIVELRVRLNRDGHLRAAGRDLHLARARVQQAPIRVLDREAVRVHAVRHRQTGLVLAVPQHVGGRHTGAPEAAHDLARLAHDLERPALGLRLGSGVEADLGHSLIAGGGEHLGLRLVAGVEPAEAVGEADTVAEPQRVIGDAVVELVRRPEAVAEAAGCAILGVAEAHRDARLDPVLGAAVEPRARPAGLVDLGRHVRAPVQKLERSAPAELGGIGLGRASQRDARAPEVEYGRADAERGGEL